MRFAFDDEQRELAATVRQALAAACPPSAVTAAWNAPAGELDPGPWKVLADMGLPSALVPADEGGLGLDERWLVLVFEEIGRSGLPHPAVETALVASALTTCMLDGSLVATDLGGGGTVPAAADAAWLVLTAPATGRLHLVAADQVRVEPRESLDRARRLGIVHWQPGDTTALDVTTAAVALARARGVFGTAAVLIGLAQTMLDMTVAYVKERHQFGVPIGSFQAVKHHLADALLAITFARPVVHRAAWSLALDRPEVPSDVAAAKAMASDAAARVGRIALQAHGAMGYNVEHDLHLFLKRATALGRAWGSAAEHRAVVADAIGLPRC